MLDDPKFEGLEPTSCQPRGCIEQPLEIGPERGDIEIRSCLGFEVRTDRVGVAFGKPVDVRVDIVVVEAHEVEPVF